jgi:hypothetical protein
MKVDNPGSCTWRAEFVALPTGVSPSDLVAGRVPTATAMTDVATFWFDQIQAMDVIGIGFNKEPAYFLGVVMGKNRGRAMLGNKVTNTVVLSGVALGSVFAQQNIMRLPTIKFAPPDSGIWHILAGTVFGRMPDLRIKTKMQLTKIVPALFSDTLSALDIRMPQGTFSGVLKHRTGDNIIRFFDFTAGLDPSLNSVYSNRVQTLENCQGSLFEIIREHAPAPWFDMWFDVAPANNATGADGAKVVLYLRAPIWDSITWSVAKNPGGNLVDKVYAEEIVSDDLKSDWTNINTIFFPQCRLEGLGGALLPPYPVSPLISTRLVKIFGLRAFKPDVTWSYAHLDEDAIEVASTIKLAQYASYQLGLWYGLADLYLSGTVKIKGRTDIRVGHKLALYQNIVAQSGMAYQDAYVDGVTQSWGLNQPWVTSLELSRVMAPDVHYRDHAEVDQMVADRESVIFDRGYGGEGSGLA